MEDDKSSAIILEKEQRALTVIREHMINSLNSKICYKYNKKKDYPGIQTESFQSFWSKCFDGYSNEIEDYCMNYAEPEETSDEDDKDDKDEYFDDYYDENYNDYIYYDLPSVSPDSEDMPKLEVEGESIPLGSPLTYFDELDKAFLAIHDWLYPAHMSSKKCDKLYLKLRKQLDKDLLRAWSIPKVNFKIRENTFTYLPEILDLGNQDICSILPYLLTAYCCNCVNNRFLYEGKTLLKQTFEVEVGEIESVDAPKLRKRIEDFCKIFSLSEVHLSSTLCSEDGRPTRKAGLSVYNDPKVVLTPKDRKVLGYIFDYWCGKIPDLALDSGIDIKIDANLCEELFLYYMNSDS